MYKQLIIFGTGLFFAALLIGFSIWRITDKDREAYQELLESSTQLQKPPISNSQHAREGVLKEIWYQGQEPLYVRIESDNSKLNFIHREGRLEVVEQLDKVICLMQEELFYEEGKPMQHVRYMEAKRGCYNYNTQAFVGEEATLWKYRLEGHEPVLSFDEEIPVMTATADMIEFTFREKEIDFKARHLKATFSEVNPL